MFREFSSSGIMRHRGNLWGGPAWDLAEPEKRHSFADFNQGKCVQDLKGTERSAVLCGSA